MFIKKRVTKFVLSGLKRKSRQEEDCEINCYYV